jgi:hypothetical protein
MNTIITIYLIDLAYLTSLRGIRGKIGLRNIKDLINLRSSLGDLRDLIDLAYLTSLLCMRDMMDPEGRISMRDMQHLLSRISMRDMRDMIGSLCNILRQETERLLALLALYSVVSTVDVPEPLQHQIEQSLQQIMKQAPLPLEQRLLISALRQLIGTAASPSPGSRSTVLPGSADERAHRLNHLKERRQRNQLHRPEEEELLAACYDRREVSEHVWKTVTEDNFFWRNTVAQLAWRLMGGQWNMTREAWQDVVTRLDDEDALMCGAAALLLQKGRDIPPEEREQGMERIQAILNDEMLSRRPLDPPDGGWLRLDDMLFDTLRALAERG